MKRLLYHTLNDYNMSQPLLQELNLRGYSQDNIQQDNICTDRPYSIIVPVAITLLAIFTVSVVMYFVFQNTE